MIKFSLARGECLTFTLSLRVIPCQYRLSDLSLKTKFFGLHFRCRKYQCRPIFNHFYIIRPKAIEFGEITQRLGLLRRSRSSKVTEFGTNWKLIYDFLLVINSNLTPIVHRFRDIALERSKTAIFWLPLLRLTPDGGVPLGRSPSIFIERSGMAKVPNGVEKLPKISIAWVGCTNRWQTTERRTGDDIIANVNVSSR